MRNQNYQSNTASTDTNKSGRGEVDGPSSLEELDMEDEIPLAILRWMVAIWNEESKRPLKSRVRSATRWR